MVLVSSGVSRRRRPDSESTPLTPGSQRSPQFPKFVEIDLFDSFAEKSVSVCFPSQPRSVREFPSFGVNKYKMIY